MRVNDQTHRRRHGYSLVELLVTVAILGIMGTLVAQIMMSQQRFFQRLTEQTDVRRELRNTVGTFPTELRGISTVGGDVSSFGATSITFRSTIGTSVVCDEQSTTVIDVPPPNTARTTVTSWVTVPAIGDTVFALRHDSLGVRGDYWSAHRITAVTTGAGLCLNSSFTDLLLDAGKLRYRFTVAPPMPDSVAVGAALRFTRTARYELASQPSGRWYLQRSEVQSGAWTTPVVMSGPYVPPAVNGTGGLVLTYFDSTGTAVAVGGNATRIARIDVTLRALAQAGSTRNRVAPNDSLRLSIAMRNRR